MTPAVHILRTGRLQYAQALKLQKSLAKHNPDGNFRNILILTEHNPVYTIGIRTKGYTAEDEERLKKLGAEFYKTNRGGLITFHGPGQLVSYPILDLKQFKPSVRWYVSQLEQTVIEVCKKFGINAQRTSDTGIWVGDRKICAIGIHGSRFITSHGLALNCNTDLEWFEHIVPCGIEGKGVTSLTKELNHNIDVNNATSTYLEFFADIFNCELHNIEDKETMNILNCIKD